VVFLKHGFTAVKLVYMTCIKALTYQRVK